MLHVFALNVEFSQSDPSYKQFVIVTLRKLLRLDGHEVLYQEKVIMHVLHVHVHVHAWFTCM